MECKRCGLPPLLLHFPNQLKLGTNAFLSEEPQGDSHGRLDSIAVGGGVSSKRTLPFFPKSRKAIRRKNGQQRTQ